MSDTATLDELAQPDKVISLFDIASRPRIISVSDPDLPDKAAALKKYFPHIRHDADFFDAAMIQLEAAHKAFKSRSWETCAEDMHWHLMNIDKKPSQSTYDFTTLLELLPAYQKMAEKAEQDYKNHGGKRWFKKPESYAAMVAYERNRPQRDSYAFNI